jgi:hypothetical protein
MMELRLHADDLKSLEDMVAKAMTRGIVSAVRMLAREGLLSGLVNGVAQAEAPPGPAFDPSPPEPVPEPAPVGAAAPEAEPESKRKPNRSLKEILKTVAHRPDGFIASEKAYEVIGGDSAPSILRTWLFERTVRAVIVAEYHGTPTKGLPGKLHVERASLKARNEVRIRNSTTPPMLRQVPPPLPDLVVWQGVLLVPPGAVSEGTH